MSDKGWEGFGSAVGSIVSERLASPLISTFVISWSLWNFKFFVILFSKNSVTATYALIQAECFPTSFMSIFNGLAAPLTLTMAYFYLLPILSKIIFNEWSQAQKETKEIKQRWEDQQLLGFADAQVLRKDLRMAEGKLEDFDTEIRKLKAQLRQADLKSAETEEAARVAEANFRKSSEELSIAHTALGEARNSVGEMQETLSTSNTMFESERNRTAELEEALNALNRPSKLSPRLESVLIEVTKGPIAFEKWSRGSNPNDRNRTIESVATLRSSGLIRRATAANGEKNLSITAEGLRYLLTHGLIDAPQLEDAIRNYWLEPEGNAEVDKNAIALANAKWTPGVVPTVVNKLLASRPDNQNITSAVKALAASNTLSDAEMNALIAKLARP